MLSGHDIICFGNDWQSDPTSKKHVMRRLSRDNRVLWVNSIGCRNPRPSGRDLKRIASKARQAFDGCHRVEESLWVFSPLAVPFHGNRVARWINRRWLAARIGGAARALGFRDFVTWSFVPTSAGVAGALGERLLVYHCVDEFSRFTGVDAASLLALEAELAAKADLVIVSSERLLDAKRPLNPSTFLVRHGVEVEHFGRALDPATELPDDMPRGPRPIVGFFGAIADWVDVDLVGAIARQRPDWTFVLIGALETDPAPLAGLANVHLLGRRTYASLPAYCKGFDVAIVPFRENELTLAANPLKLREYMAAGLPVVSTALPEVEVLGPAVRIGRSPSGFLDEIEAALAEAPSGPSRSRAALVRDESWESKTEEMCGLVERFLPRAGGLSALGGGAA